MYECHITIEPVFDERRTLASQIAEHHSFKLAELLMKKGREATEERSDKDTFMTGHHVDYAALFRKMCDCIEQLKRAGFRVWRYKIEDIVIDSKYQIDIYDLLSEPAHAH